MEFIICMLLASVITGGRFGVDAIHALKGTTPAHLEKARLKAQRQPKAPKSRSPYADGKPQLKDVAAVYWGDAMADAISAHNRRREEKTGRVKTPLKERLKRFGRLLWEPVGEKPADTPAGPEPVRPAEDLHPRNPQPEGASVIGDELIPEVNNAPQPDAPRPAPQPVVNPYQPTGAGQPTAGGAPTGEAVNYETTVAELEALIERLRAHLDSVTAAHASAQHAKTSISDAQASYNPAAQAAASISEHLPALNVDAETVGHTGTVANAMPPNAVNGMFDHLEAMEQALLEQRSNAEAALGSAEQALRTVQEKYGDAHTTVASELAGDARFLAGSGAHTA